MVNYHWCICCRNYIAIIPSTIRPDTTCDVSVVIMPHVAADVVVDVTLNVTVDNEDGSRTVSVIEVSETCVPGVCLQVSHRGARDLSASSDLQALNFRLLSSSYCLKLSND